MSNFVYSHGFGSNSSKVKRYIDKDILPVDSISFDYQDAYYKFMGMGLNIWSTCLGQEGDMQTLDKYVTDDTVLFGESRGASTIINYLGTTGRTVKAAILDSPFDKLYNVLALRMNRFYLDRLISVDTVEYYFPYLFRNYKIDGIQPLNSVMSISKDTPILFICSYEDKEVPYVSSINMYTKLRHQGYDKVHLLCLEDGGHGWLMASKFEKLYRNVIHAFYRRYHIEHTSEYAEAGRQYFDAHCQPDGYGTCM